MRRFPTLALAALLAIAPAGAAFADVSPVRSIDVGCQVRCVAFSPDGTSIASADFDGTAKVWDAESGALKFSIPAHSAHTFGIAYSPDGKYIATGGSGAVAKLWDAATGNAVRTFEQQHNIAVGGEDHDVWFVRFTPDGKYLAFGGADGCFTIGDVATGKAIYGKKEADEVRTLDFTANGQYLVVAAHSSATVRATAGGAYANPSYNVGNGVHIFSARVSPDMSMVALGAQGGFVPIYNSMTSERIKDKRHSDSGNIDSVAWSPDGKWLASAGDGGVVKLWTLASDKSTKLVGHGGTVWSVDFSRDGKRLVSGSWDKTIKIWDVPSAP